MKYLILTLSLSLFYTFSFSQTYLTPSIGYDFMSMKSVFIEPDFHGFEVFSPPYSIKGIQYGLEIKQILYKKLSGSINLCFTQRKVEATRYGFVPISGFEFDYWRGNILLNYQIIRFLEIGIGYDYNQLKDLTYTFHGQAYSKFKPLIIDQGINISIRGYWNNIEFKGYFHRGMNSNISESPLELSIKPINYIGFSLGYRIKIINSFNRDKKAECPTF